ncbi:immunoglobulin-like domain-containing protein [Beduini massiliensis]|uniref:immunoglobulin-like domain-containing protein n=1 Tax=Beduini massiliensis TaxID=1585974 RepID=UPI00059A9890|nr:immunoglobulin-like domain-containing protein [Beduini massiliensis]
MDFSIKQASQLALYIVLCTLFLYGFTQFLLQMNNRPTLTTNEFITPDIQYSALSIHADKIALKLNEDYDLKSFVLATDEIDGDISKNVEIYDNINIKEKGYYKVRFAVKNSNGQWADKIVDVRVDE